MASSPSLPKETRQKLTLLDLGLYDVEIPASTPLSIQHALKIEALVKASYPMIECVFDKIAYTLLLRDRKNVKRTFNKRYTLKLCFGSDILKDSKLNSETIIEMTRVYTLLSTNIEQYITLNLSGGSIVKILRMPSELHSQYLFRYIDLDGSVKTKKKEKIWIALKLMISSGSAAALIIGILALI